MKTFQSETDVVGRSQQQGLSTEWQWRKSLFISGNRSEAVKAHSEETVRAASLGVVSLCRGNRAVSNEFLLIEKGTHYHVCILCVQFFIRLCKHKKC